MLKDIKPKYNALDYLNIIWTVFVYIIVIIITISVYLVSNNRFETAIISLLILIYLSINSYFSTSEYYRRGELIAYLNEFYKIRYLLKDKNIQIEEEYYNSEISKGHINITKFWIGAVFNSIIFIIVLLALFGAILSPY